MQKMSIDRPLVLTGPTMGTVWSVTVDQPLDANQKQVLQAQFQGAVQSVDAQMSTWKPDSDLMRLNAAALNTWVPVPKALITVLDAGLAISRDTAGAFEMNIGDAVRAWGFGAGAPDLAAIKAASTLRRVPATTALEVDHATGCVRKSAPLALDLSGIAKGYGVDCLARTAADFGLRHALCAIDGELRAVGARQNGQAWSVGIDAPDSGPPDSAARGNHSVLALVQMAVATSGDYRHFVTVRNTRLSHTMNPHRGAPVLGAPASVTVLSASCMQADAIATALMVLGPIEGAAFARRKEISALFLLRGEPDHSLIGTGIFAQTPPA